MHDNVKIGEKPQLEYYKSNDIDMIRIPYEIREISPSIYSWREISVKFMNFNYGSLVSALIGLQYSSSEMIAIINNYLLDPDDETIKNEFNAMQNCRKQAKITAKEIVEYYNLDM